MADSLICPRCGKGIPMGDSAMDKGTIVHRGCLDNCPCCGLAKALCQSCGAPIVWAISERGKPWPLDYARATIAVRIAAFDSMNHPEIRWQTSKGHVPHHITCPQGAQWKGQRRPGGMEQSTPPGALTLATPPTAESNHAISLSSRWARAPPGVIPSTTVPIRRPFFPSGPESIPPKWPGGSTSRPASFSWG